MTLEAIANEIRGRLADMKGTPEEMREELLDSLLHTYRHAEMSQVHILMFSPEAGFMFAMKVNESLGAVNEVLFKEYSIQPVHIKELNLAVVDTIEEVTGDSIDTVFEKLQG
jgi:hypothetical protein